MHRVTGHESRRRIALYSHDTQGLGHIRRNIALASALVAAHPATDVLLLTGAPEATCLPLPPWTETVTLPTLRKDIQGRYRPRVLGTSLTDLLRIRAQLIGSAVASFEPDLFVVDKVARGIGGELDQALRTLRHRSTKVVLGLRDVLDSPSVTFSEWRAAGISETVRDLYDQVWVYGDPGVYDAASAYGWSWPVRSKMIYTGYLAHGRSRSAESHRPRAADPAPPVDPYVLCLVGGGQDGGQLAEAFLAADLPVGHRGVLLTGPYLPPDRREQLDRMVSRRPEMSIHRFVSRAEEFIGSAAATVTMGGYNSVCESLAAGGPTLVVPRVVPRVEQVMRADALSRAGWLDVLLPAELSPGRIGGWLAAAVIGGRRPRRPIDLDGLARVPRLVDGLLERSSEVVHAVG